MIMKNYVLNHTRVSVYRVTHNQNHNNFLISPRLLQETVIRFKYVINGVEIEKKVPLEYIGPHLKYKRFFHTDEYTLKKEFRGEAYSIDADIIFNY